MSRGMLSKLAKTLLPGGLQRAISHRRLTKAHGFSLSGNADECQLVQTTFGKRCRLGAPVYIAMSRVDDYSYVEPHCRISETDIGKFCSIATNVVIGPPDHPLDRVSTHPAFFLHEPRFGYTFDIPVWDDGRARTTIGNDVWIGHGAMIRRGVQVADGAIIGAGAVVVKDVPPYAIVGGVPARVLRYRFEPEAIGRMLAIRWWDQDYDWIVKHAHLFHVPKAFLDAVSVQREKNEAGRARV